MVKCPNGSKKLGDELRDPRHIQPLLFLFGRAQLVKKLQVLHLLEETGFHEEPTVHAFLEELTRRPHREKGAKNDLIRQAARRILARKKWQERREATKSRKPR